MNLATLNNYIVLEDEVEEIGRRIIDDRLADTPKFVYYLENIEFYPSKNQVSIHAVECGAKGHTEDQLIRVSFNEFCDPKYLLDKPE